jgi:uncharacterized protein (TIGR03086 family)
MLARDPDSRLPMRAQHPPEAKMTAPTDPVTMLSITLEQARTIMVGVRPDQQHLPTPCRSWDVTDLMAHLVDDVARFTESASGGTPDWSAPPAAIEGDPITAFTVGATELVEAWRAAGDLSGTTEMPGMGEVPKRFPVDQQIAEFAVHGWDLAVATGQTADLDPNVAEVALAWGRTALSPQFRGAEEDGKVFGPEVELPDDAPPYDRLAGFFGHHAG